MNTLDCPRCGHRLAIAAGGAPRECPNCFNELPRGAQSSACTAPAPEPRSRPSTAVGLTLRYQATGETISIPAGERVVLGREAHGREVLRVAQISRQHCLVDHVEGCFRVTDLESRHGTFVGVERRDCRTSPRQPLRNGDVLVLGQEVFFVAIDGAEEVQKTQAYVAAGAPSAPEPPPRSREFECRNCREYRAPEPPPDGVCPRCYAYNPPM